MLEDLQGMAMWWFNKGERKEVWDEEIRWPIGDIQTAHKIRDTAVPPPTVRRKLAALPTAQTKTNPISNYERAAKAAMQIAIKISDDLMRDSAVRQIVKRPRTASASACVRHFLRPHCRYGRCCYHYSASSCGVRQSDRFSASLCAPKAAPRRLSLVAGERSAWSRGD